MNHPRQSDRAFGLTFAVLFVLVFCVARFIFEIDVIWPAVVAGIFFMVSIFVPGSLLPLNVAWSSIVLRLGKVNNHIVLGLFFVVFVIPTSLIFRALKYDPMSRRLDPTSESYWSEITRHTDGSTLKDMF